jgi:hypothetical protein
MLLFLDSRSRQKNFLAWILKLPTLAMFLGISKCLFSTSTSQYFQSNVYLKLMENSLLRIAITDAFDSLMSKRGHQPGRPSYYGDETQDRLYSFLLSFCKIVLHDITRQLLYDMSLPIEPISTLISDSWGEKGLT